MLRIYASINIAFTSKHLGLNLCHPFIYNPKSQYFMNSTSSNLEALLVTYSLKCLSCSRMKNNAMFNTDNYLLTLRPLPEFIT